MGFQKDDNLSRSIKGGEEANNFEFDKLLSKKIQPSKVWVGARMVKRYIRQVTISHDSAGIQGGSQPFP